MTATSAALQTWQRVYENPEQVQGSGFTSRANFYRMLWSYYENSAFERIKNSSDWTQYAKNYGLYRQMRSIYNPMRRLVDFYSGIIYPGVLSEDGQELPDGVALAIPLPDRVPQGLKDAIAQFWDWSNWQSGKSVMVRYGAVAGSVLVEVVDDLEHQKIAANIVWPGLVTDLVLDSSGNVKAYAKEYQVQEKQTIRKNEPRGTSYVFRKEVDQDEIRYYRDGKSFTYDDNQPAVSANPYGFVPAVWVKHRDLGGDHGAPAIYGSLPKVDELNSLASHAHDQVHKVIAAPAVLWSAGNVGSLFATKKRGQTDEFTDANADRESLLMLKGPAGGKVDSLTGNLDMADVLPFMRSLLDEIEDDHPELTLYTQLRDMSQVTGPGASRMMGDVVALVIESQANYDIQMRKLHQMAVAIGGWRTQNGWTDQDQRHEKFDGYDVESYRKGDLDHIISPRPLIPLTPEEALRREQLRLSVESDKQMLAQGQVGGGDPVESRLRAAGQRPEPAPNGPGVNDGKDPATGPIGNR